MGEEAKGAHSNDTAWYGDRIIYCHRDGGIDTKDMRFDKTKQGGEMPIYAIKNGETT
ncbi:MAG: hypothetical protein M1130_10715 [Actinobacteria bacterium]|nr:hypothetical protein [Actinomycetota bacterium]